MAKKKTGTTETTDAKTPAKVGFKGHRDKFEENGNVLVHESRPRGKPYTIEEWLTTGRGFKLLKVFDGGTIVAFNEDQKFEDSTAAAESIR